MFAGHNLAVSCTQQSHTRLPFSKHFQILYIFMQIFKHFTVFLKNRTCAFTFQNRPGLIKKKLLGKVPLNSLGPQTNIQAPKVQNTAMMVESCKGEIQLLHYHKYQNLESPSPCQLLFHFDNPSSNIHIFTSTSSIPLTKK